MIRCLLPTWLSALLSLVASSCRSHPSSSSTLHTARPWFEDRARASRITWRLGHHGRSPLTIREVMGTGCAVLDFDNDGWDDLFFVGQKGVGNTGRCALYRNRGDGTFEEVTRGSGLEHPGDYMGCATADVDNDGDTDIFVSGYGVNRLFRNEGHGRFKDITTHAGLQARAPTEWNSAAAFGDFDNDGWIDLYVGKYVVFHAQTPQFCDFAGVLANCKPQVYAPQKGSLYRNRGNGQFQDVTQSAGLSDQNGKTLGAIFADYNRDGRIDLYLANDGMPCDLYENLGGRFRNVGAVSGTAYREGGDTQAGMGVDFADYNGDSWLDLVVTTFQGEETSLYANRSGTHFEPCAATAGLDAATRALVGFGACFADFDNDGWVDLAIANGHVRDNEEKVDKFSSYRQPLQLFLNRDGKRFIERTKQAGAGFTTPAVGRGLATGDFNRDGRVDLVAVDLEGAPRLLMNLTTTTHKWIGFHLRGARSNRLAIGAVVTVEVGNHTYVSECRTSGSYFSAVSPTVHVGLGNASGTARATIRWTSGKQTTLNHLALNRYHTVDEAKGVLTPER